MGDIERLRELIEEIQNESYKDGYKEGFRDGLKWCKEQKMDEEVKDE